MFRQKQVGNYTLLARLGSGTNATVYKARLAACPLAPLVAVKAIAATPASMDALVEEFRVLQRCAHNAHVVTLLDAFRDAQNVYIVMELCAGGDLSGHLKSAKTLSESDARHFLRQLADALGFLRAHNISHMDLKPSNILLTTDTPPELKLADFGLARRLREGALQSGPISGSLLYIAPEVLTKQYDARCDLWSVGIILYESLFGRAPFHTASQDELIAQLRSQEPVWLPQSPPLSADCRDLLQSLLQRDPSKRISFDDFFAHPFVDLRHLPSANSLTTALATVKRATELDSRGKCSDAFPVYLDALDHFFAALTFERNDPARCAELRERILPYVERAETLKKSLTSEMRREAESMPSAEALDRVASQNEHAARALLLAQHALRADRFGDHHDALEHYVEAVELFLRAADELETTQAAPLRKEVMRYLKRAEALKSQLRITDSDPRQKLGNSDRSSCSIM